MMVDINMSWVERLRAPRYLWSQIAAHNPQRGILCREQESQQQLLAWDVTTGDTRSITLPVPYTLNATLSPDGEFITYLAVHPNHQEVFQYVRVPYLGGDPQPMALTALMYASPHIEEATNERIGFTAVTGNGYSVQVWTPTSAKPLFSFDSEILAYGPSLSADGTIAVIATLQSDTSESTHLEAYNIDTGEKIGQLELLDTPLEAVKFAPVMGDSRLLVQAREGLLTRPLIWDVKTGAVDRLEGEGKNALGEKSSYTAWDWVGDESLLLHHETGEHSLLFVYDLVKQQSDFSVFGWTTWGIFTAAFHSESKIVLHFEDIFATHVKLFSAFKETEVRFLSNKGEERITLVQSNSRLPSWSRFSLKDEGLDSEKMKQGIVGVSLEDEPKSYSEITAWVDQEVTYTHTYLEKSNLEISLKLIEDARHSHDKSSYSPLLIAHSMSASYALLALHNNSSMWAGGVVVRPILDWVHLYESASPPEKAMMRLWFGGSPTEKPREWRAASPLRQTTPLTVPVKLLYHPYESLTPIQHIQTYAANNPTVELIDISRDLVGAPHEQQERLIMRMLQVGLPLL